MFAPFLRAFVGVLTLLAGSTVHAQFVAYNDHAPGPLTHSNTTTWHALGASPGSGGFLKDIGTGANLPVRLTITASGVVGDVSQSQPAAGSPAHTVFNGFVDFLGEPTPSLEIAGDATVLYTFTGLDPSKRYTFMGTAVRGNASYTDRWTLFELIEAESFTNAHTRNTLTSARVAALAVNQAAIAVGLNSTAETGDMAVWTGIHPGADGMFAVRCRQYTGDVPDGSSGGSKSYGMTAVRLEEYNVVPVPARITTGPQSITVDELAEVVFDVLAEGNPAPGFQWLRNDSAIPGATNWSHTIPAAQVADNGAVFKVIVSNKIGDVTHTETSSPATLTVRPDLTAPTVTRVQTIGLNQIEIQFSEAVHPATGTNAANYGISGPDGAVAILSASVGATPDKVVLDVGLLQENADYTLVLNGIQDQSAAANSIEANTQRAFSPVTYAPHTIGNPPLAGGIRAVTGGYDVWGSGVGISTNRDQFHFAYQKHIGDFDIQVRVAELTVTDPYVKAGLMARETLDDNARFAGVFASSAQLGSFFGSRSTLTGPVALQGPAQKFPSNYPWAWLRLRRAGNEFTGFGSLDGERWQQLGSLTLTLPTEVFFGMAVASDNVQQVATGKFRQIGATQSTATFSYAPQREPIGPSNRRTGLIFSEILHSPRERLDGKNLEFLEIYNGGAIFQDLTGWSITEGIQFKFPAGFRLNAGAFVVIAADPDAVKQAYGITNVLGPYEGRLGGSDTLVLNNKSGARRAEVDYSSSAPWPAGANGAGHSLVCLRPSYGEEDPRAWGASALAGGSPGMDDPISPNRWSGVTINEFLASPLNGQAEFIELHNAGNAVVDLSGCYLTDSPSTNKHRIPDGTQIGPRQWLAFNTADLGFGLSSSGESIYLVSADESRVIDAVVYEGQEPGVSFGRSPDGAGPFRRMEAVTQGTRNSARRLEAVVINELMYDPISGEDDDQYVELHNRSQTPVDIGGWSFSDGITFAFPFGSSIPAGGYVVVARNVQRMLTNYTHLTPQNIFGPYSGNLSGGGERVALAKLIGGEAVTVSEVTYFTGGRWPSLADGGGSSLELRDPRADTTQASSWAASDESQKGQWASYEATSQLNFSNTGKTANKVYLVSLGGGEYLVDDLQVIRADGVNVLTNANFERGQTGWTFYGNHGASAIQSSGAIEGNNCLVLRAEDIGDTAPNSVRGSLMSTLAANSMVTLRAKARWVSGWPELLFRVRGNGAELPIIITPPTNLGTPGLANSARASNAGPNIREVTHYPPAPAANQPVVVTARIGDPDGVVSPRLLFRVDPSNTATTVQMRDDGLNGDVLAGDGIYAATIPARSSGLVAFNIQAQDGASPFASARFPAELGREGLIRWGDPTPFGSVPHYHSWSTAASNSDLNSGTGLERDYRDTTVIYHNRVIYNAGIRPKGSPYHSGRGSYSISLPKDEPLLGDDKNVFSSTGNGVNEGTQSAVDMAYWIGGQIDVPYNHSHYVRLYRNGSLAYNYPVMYNRETPSRSTAEDWFGGGGLNDTLYKIAVWFEFDDNNGGGTSGTMPASFTKKPATAPPYKTAAYRWNWQTHPGGKTANDFSLLYNLITASLAQDKVTGMMSLADMEQWMRVFAWQRAMGNWDHWSLRTGQNMYMYAPLGEKARLIPWDLDFVLGIGDGATTDSLFTAEQDAAIRTLINLPIYKRMMWRAYKDLIEGPMEKAISDEQLDSRRSALLKNNISAGANGSIKSYISTRRSFIATRLLRADPPQFAVHTRDFTTNTSTATITGVAPFAIATLEINGVPYIGAWTGSGATNWSVQIPLSSGTNLVHIVGKDLRGNAVPGAEGQLAIHYTGSAPNPQDWVVINEIMFAPSQPNAQFVEIFNRHASHPFDLSGVEIRPLGLTLPPGTLIQPRGFLVAALDSASFAAAHGATIPLIGELETPPSEMGGVIQLVKPGASAETDLLISEVGYQNAFPWPVIAPRSAVSLQLVDASQDIRRLNNWEVAAVAPFSTPGAPNSTVGSLQDLPLWINEVQPINLAGLRDSTGQPKPWIELFNPGLLPISLEGHYLSRDPADLTQWAFPPDAVALPGEHKVVFVDGAPELTTSTELHAGFQLGTGQGSLFLSRLEGEEIRVLEYMRYPDAPGGQSFGSFPNGQPVHRQLFLNPTPGAPNIGGNAGPLEISSITLLGAEIELAWPAQPGAVYRVEATADLAQPNWGVIAPSLAAAGETATVRVPVAGAGRLFLRIVRAQ